MSSCQCRPSRDKKAEPSGPPILGSNNTASRHRKKTSNLGVHRGILRKRREEAEINTVKPKTKTKSEAVNS
jgi:hypothetical protein